MNQQTTAIPEGFEAIGHGGHSGHFADAIGPFYVQAKGDGGFRYAFRTSARHANANGVTHGGALFSFADHITGHAIVYGIKRGCATLKFKVEYLAPGPLDCLVEGEVEIQRITRTMVFLRVRLFTGHRTLMTADGCCKLFAPIEPGAYVGAAPTSQPPGADRPTAPEGFQPFPDQGAFPGLCGPVYYRRRADGGFINGFHSRAVHDNTNGIVHGGVLFTFADDIIGRAASGISRRYATTIAMNVEYISVGPLDKWIEGTTEVTHMDDGFAFIRARVQHEDRIILTADGVCRLLQPYIKKQPEAAA